MKKGKRKTKNAHTRLVDVKHTIGFRYEPIYMFTFLSKVVTCKGSRTPVPFATLSCVATHEKTNTHSFFLYYYLYFFLVKQEYYYLY